jgi:hypothetical protein
LAKRIRVGDVVEVATSNGLAYAQVSHIHREERSAYGPLLRVLPGLFLKRPAQLAELVSQDATVLMFCALSAAVRNGICEIVDNVPVPEKYREFPVFRTTDDPAGIAGNWAFWMATRRGSSGRRSLRSKGRCRSARSATVSCSANGSNRAGQARSAEGHPCRGMRVTRSGQGAMDRLTSACSRRPSAAADPGR